MASYPAPTETLPLFSPSAFDVNDVPLTITDGAKYFITYPTAQGAITIPTLTSGTLNVSGTATITNTSVSGTATIGTATITNASVSGTDTIGTANITTASVSGTLTTNTITPTYLTSSLASGNIGFIQTASITYPGTTTNIIASNISANGTWVVYCQLNFTGMTTTPQLIVQDASLTTLGVLGALLRAGTDHYNTAFCVYTITGSANVVSIRLSLAPTTGGANGGDTNQYVRFVRIA